ncbi:prolyl-tRNA synthetase [Roseobacter sp. MED193]|nr:prolyl-tRNA synthetase [Roseobacter sp. MED193]
MIGMLQTLEKTNSYEIHIWPPGVLSEQDAELLAVTRAQVGYFQPIAQGSKAAVGGRGHFRS